ncbi:MAG TPA: DEAD/DEAH box helicase, partial [Cyclobacteriaceae bacterium]|nr:DEAD/DEAH box helicase [Cyclobacteriaceae bacterium]
MLQLSNLSYPVLDIIPALKEKLSNQTTVILQAPPGAGKSTILPLELLHEPWLHDKKIIMLEPRRLAARSVAMRMASLLDEEAGQTIGYRVRFENKISAKTRIEVVTEGILTRMIQSDNALEGVAMVIFDEFHERSLQADLESKPQARRSHAAPAFRPPPGRARGAGRGGPFRTARGPRLPGGRLLPLGDHGRAG